MSSGTSPLVERAAFPVPEHRVEPGGVQIQDLAGGAGIALPSCEPLQYAVAERVGSWWA